MNMIELNREMGGNKMSIAKLSHLTGIGKKKLYSRFRGDTPFTQTEIVAISKALGLSDDKIMSIFFAPQVS